MKSLSLETILVLAIFGSAVALTSACGEGDENPGNGGGNGGDTPTINLDDWTLGDACTVDADGCVVAGDTICVMTAKKKTGDGEVKVHVVGSITPGPATGTIDVASSAVTGGYEPVGYWASVSLASNLGPSMALMDTSHVAVEKADWSFSGDTLDVTYDASFTASSTSATLNVSAEGAPNTPLQSAAMGTAEGDTLLISIWRARVCGLTVTGLL